MSLILNYPIKTNLDDGDFFLLGTASATYSCTFETFKKAVKGVITNPYLTFSSPNQFSISCHLQSWDGTIEYSTNTVDWIEWVADVHTAEMPTLVSETAVDSEVIYIRGIGNTRISFMPGDDPVPWHITGSEVSCTGNIETLLDYRVVLNGGHPEMGDSCFSSLFNNNPSLVSCPELPSTVLSLYCYEGMFTYCTSLNRLPILPAENLPDGCYSYMFSGCTSIKLSESQSGEYQNPYRIPTQYTGSEGYRSLNNMFYETGGIFTGTPTINTTYYTSNQVV